MQLLGEITGITVVKTGAEGSMVYSKGEMKKIGARPSRPVDTTGAGDMYAAGFLYGMIRNQPLEICGQIGATIAGKVIEVYGAKMDESIWEKLRREIKAMMV